MKVLSLFSGIGAFEFAIFENVKNLVGKRFKAEFETVLSTLDEIGYNTYWQVLNAKDYGIPQNRERVFGISIRKDIDKGYTFPKKQELTLRLKDLLETNVDEKYYLSEDVQKRFKLTDETFSKNVIGTTKPDFRKLGQRDRVYCGESIIGGLTATDYKQPKQVIEHIGNVNIGNNESNNRVYSTNGLSPTLNTMQGGHRQPKIIEPVILDDRDKGFGIKISNICPTQRAERYGIKVIEPVICASRGRNPENPSSRIAGEYTEQRIEINKTGCSNTLTSVKKDNYVLEPLLVGGIGEKNFGKQYRQGNRVYDSNSIATCLLSQPLGNAGGYSSLYRLPDFRIRKLTPKECFRLMGFKDEYFDKIKGISNTQLYKQAGNSIVVNVLRAIFLELQKQYPEYIEKDL